MMLQMVISQVSFLEHWLLSGGPHNVNERRAGGRNAHARPLLAWLEPPYRGKYRLFVCLTLCKMRRALLTFLDCKAELIDTCELV